MCAVATSRGALPLRIGHGFDLHRLEPGLPLILGGVTLEHDRGCAGHSDGDAVYHCVVDAVLGALSLPDIGQLFPDTDPRFKGCASHVFMTAAYERLAAQGYKIGNVDVTIILERPKMAPHKELIRKNIAQLLHTHVDNVNVKAKTHEKVDAVGENRAVSVHTVALLVEDDDNNDAAASAATEVQVGVEAKAASAGLRTGSKVVSSLLELAGNRAKAINDITLSTGDAQHASDKLYNIVASRRGADPSTSWTAKLFSKGRSKIAQKVGEEAVEVVIDAIANDRERVVKESADLLYHLNVLWADMSIAPDDVWSELESRQNKSGLEEKAARKGE